MRSYFLKYGAWLLILGSILSPSNLMAEEVSKVLLNEQGVLDKNDYQLEDGAFLDVYPIDININSSLFISLETDEFDGYLILLNKKDEEVGESSYFYGDNAGILLEEVDAGNYKIGVTSLELSKIGKYKLKVEAIDQHKLIELQADFFFNQGTFLAGKGNKNYLLDAIENFDKALANYKKINEQEDIFIVLHEIGVIYANLGKIQKALEYYQQALPLTKAVGERSGEAIILNSIGLVYVDLGEMHKALDYYQQALTLSKAVEDRRGESTILNNIGGVYLQLGEIHKALDYFQQDLTLSKAA